MGGRPEVLWPLFAGLETLDGVGSKTARLFEAIAVRTPRDLLFHLPHAIIERLLRDTIRGLDYPATATVTVTIAAHMPPRTRGRPYRVQVRDSTTEFQLVFFQARGDYLQKLLPTGQKRIVSGKVELFDGIAQMVHPDHILREADTATLPAAEPIYSLAAGLTQKLLARAIRSALAMTPDLPEWIDPVLLAREGWPGWGAAVRAAHTPQTFADTDLSAPARQRLAYDEFFTHQMALALARMGERRKPGRESIATGKLQHRVLSALPYRLTDAQTRAISEIAADMAAPQRMNRLLQGDVGAGKTLVAFMALLIAVEAGGQGVMMAPTEILARQHLESLRPLAELAGIGLEILTGRDKSSERAAKLSALADGRTHILVGTHAVFQKGVSFQDLRLAIIDEQHRFGVAQRAALAAKGANADVLVMTATPIPRSLALTQYGDMDVSILDEKPPGRLPVQTALVSAARIDEVVAHLYKAIAEGRQAYWVCPLVEESEFTSLTAAQSRFEHLRAALGERVGLVHGQMPPADKDAAMADFVAGRTAILVATTVIEVGVNVPNASIMVIERADIFGLAQLHQLRGRVGRGSAASTCVLMYEPPLGETASRRLKLMRDTEDGFRIAEEDLAIRGAGDLIGTTQSGLPRFRVGDLERQAGLMAMAQRDVRNLLAQDPKMESPRGKAARTALWLMEQDKAIKLLSVG
ncbi:MAG: ATP-dependent DNA helicase RecG [Roseinatronobacter sp.]